MVLSVRVFDGVGVGVGVGFIFLFFLEYCIESQ